MTNKPSFKIAIVGGGAVGKAISAYYGRVKIYDKYHPVDSLDEVCDADYIFVAVPTPFDDAKGQPDLTEMDDVLTVLAKNMKRPAEQVVIIKSTVFPGTTHGYQEKFPSLNLIFNPEFLTEKTAVEDFARPDKQLVGFTSKSVEFAEKAMSILPRAPYEKIMHARAAEMTKYVINTYYAFKVIFGNSIYDLCQKTGADYDQVREGLVRDKRIIDSHFDVLHGGYRGYGGKCLPKDVKTLAWFGSKNGKPVKFIETIIKLNEKLAWQKHL
ncbi:MAG: hypothetical protein A2751_02990 [Candidatus Doudnabacteria bacterium RIFCSPHIGHO2_01_FULL_46_14]|uniref:UDP-glucose/GDP-mannose dehydrogenase dimerisation domain-containing protein n=1 Tax=Candidatus Doudnabacteria bacterium RIFCSPHIGHO2_01_FULL_46_14 TaxID=1817824 RepID=A0A1F5NKM9_9BACT|nr:MAG: hypothetical protein A2751_02990 [Candidatus Doudnabacteria bacterium RIFCSPHIGHO2_01_FULL_46_14]